MIVQYSQVAPEKRDLIRYFESKSYINFIRYMLLKQYPFSKIKRELMQMGLSWDEQSNFDIYFKEVILPELKKRGLDSFYKRYKHGDFTELLTISKTFNGYDRERILFIDLINDFDVSDFFAEEIIAHYGSLKSVPRHPLTGKKMIEDVEPVNITAILQNPKRHVIEDLLLHGYGSKQITEHLFQRFDMEISEREIEVYSKSFFNVTRQDVKKSVDALQIEQENLEHQIMEIRSKPEHEFGYGERFATLSTLSSRIDQLKAMIHKLSGIHTKSSYGESLIEITDVKEMFQDVMVRSHRRFRTMDDRTEDEVVTPLSKVVTMMSTATQRILAIDESMKDKEDKSINEEMLEVLGPTLERIEQEEREAMFAYKKSLGVDQEEEDDDEILGLDDE